MAYATLEAKRAADRAYYERNRDARRAAMAARHAANRDAILLQRRQAYAANREEITAARRLRYQTDPEYRAGVLAAQADYNASRVISATERFRAWEAAHPGSTAASKAAYRERNRESLRTASREYTRLWRLAHPDQANDAARIRRARLAEVPSEPIRRSVVWERDEGVCHICREPADLDDWHLDHVVPLSKGGPNLYTNVAVSHPVCNLRKHVSLVDEEA